MELIPIKQTWAENGNLMQPPDSREIVQLTIAFYDKTGFDPPWIGYLAQMNGNLVGSAGFKGRPIAGKVEIAYGTFAAYQHQGIGTEICNQLILLARQTDPAIRITARTLPENIPSEKY